MAKRKTRGGKAGRPPKAGARYDNGRLRQASRTDHGTIETRLRQVLITGGGNPALAEYPLGVLLAHKVVSQAQHDGGCHFAFLRAMLFGKANASAQHWPGMSLATAADPDEHKVKAWRNSYANKQRFLRELPAIAAKQIDQVVIYGHAPRWFGCHQPRHRDVVEAAALIAALDKIS